MITRHIDAVIAKHYASGHQALLLTGARQTGKTFAIRKYANQHNMKLIEKYYSG